MKKIALAISLLRGGGAERVVSVWASQLVQKGYDVTVILMHRTKDEYELHPDVKVNAIEEEKEKYLQLSFCDKIKKLRAILKRIQPDCVISFLPKMQIMMMFASAGMNVKRIETIRNNPTEVYKKRCLESFLWNGCFSSCKALIVQTTGQMKFFSKAVQKKAVLIPNPIAKQFTNDFKKEYSGKIRNFVAAGRMNPQKNFLMLIRAFALSAEKHPDMRLKIYGSGNNSYKNKLEALIKELGMENNIALMGKTNQLVEVYRKSDAFIMSSNFEGMPNALAEAMATKLVCISTDCPTGPSDLIDNGENGFLVAVDDAGKMAQAINMVAELDQTRQQQIAEGARKKVLAFCDEENSLEKIIETVESLK